jgi:hypothetical protein
VESSISFQHSWRHARQFSLDVKDRQNEEMVVEHTLKEKAKRRTGYVAIRIVRDFVARLAIWCAATV